MDRESINTALLHEWTTAFRLSKGKQIRLKAYAAKRIAELSVEPQDVDQTRAHRVAQHRGYNYKVDQAAESKRVRGAAVELAGQFPKRSWALDEIEYIHANFKVKTVLEIALDLRRSYESVMHKMNREGLLRNKKWLTAPPKQIKQP